MTDAYQDGLESTMYVEPERTSVMAILALVFSLVCFIPPLGLIGAVLGIASLVVISRARGRLAGTGMAVTGIVIGLLVTVLQLGLVIGARVGLEQFFVKVVEPTEQIIATIDQEDWDGARAYFGGAQPTDEQFAAFRDAYQAEVGGFVRMPDNLMSMMEGYNRVGQSMQSVQSQDSIPMPVEFDKGWVVLLLEPDPQGSSQGLAAANIGIHASSGNSIWLLGPKAASGGSESGGDDEPDGENSGDEGDEGS